MNQTILVLMAVLSFSALADHKTIVYDWLTLGKKSGTQSVTYLENETTKVSFSFQDRGRGPSTEEVITLNDSGLMTKYSITGNAYMGADVAESFRLQNEKAEWKSAQEQGSIKIQQPAFYLPANASPEVMAMLTRYMLAQQDNTANLLPSGEASIEILLTTTVSANKQQKQVRLVALNGLDFTPNYQWFDESNQLFALAYGWMGMTAQGWSEVLPKLQELQDKADADYQNKLAKKLTQILKGSIRIDDVNLLDVETGQFLKETVVRVVDGKITALGKQAKVEADHVINGRNKTLMPGLWDMHTHVSLSDGPLHVAAGVTSVRDLANTHEDLMKTIEAFESAQAIGPSVYKAGFIDQKSPYAAPTGKLADTLDEALAHVDWYAQRDYPQIKIYSSITPSWVKPIAERIHGHGMKLSGHIPSFMTTAQAIKDGFDEIQHINMVFLNFLATEKDDTRTPVRFTLVGEKAGELDLDSKQVNDFIQLMKKNKTVVDPTVSIFHSMFLNKAGEVDPTYASVADHMPANVRRGLLASTLDINAQNEAQYAASAQALLEMIKRLHEAGIQLVAGTDAIAGFTLHRELELYAKAGISQADVLRIATIDSAKVIGVESRTGSIAVGKDADLVLIEGNPLENISDLRKVVWTLKGQHLYESSQLYQSLGVKPFVSNK